MHNILAIRWIYYYTELARAARHSAKAIHLTADIDMY